MIPVSFRSRAWVAVGALAAAVCSASPALAQRRKVAVSVAPSSDGCEDDSECKAPRICAQKQCVSREVAASLPGACHADSECKGSRYCDSGRCVSPAEGPSRPVVVAAPARIAAPAPAFAPVATRAPAIAYASSTPQRSAFAFVVGVEHYRELPSPGGARADALGFAEVARKMLGIPETNIRVAIDDHASKTDLLKGFEWLKANTTPGSRVYFFYSGHGAPDPTSGTSYLVPYDGDPQYLATTAIAMNDALSSLAATGAHEVVAFVDSCFSGAGGRSVLPPGARPLVVLRNQGVANSIALLSSSGANEISGPAHGGSNGVFSKYLLAGLGRGEADADGDGQITLDELNAFIRPRVTREAKQDNREQTPSLVVGQNVNARDLALAWGVSK